MPEILRAKVSIFVELFLKAGELQRSLTAVTTLSDKFRDSEARTRSVLDNVADGIVTLSDNGRHRIVQPRGDRHVRLRRA